MSYSIDIRAALAAGNPVLFWVNKGDPYIISSVNVAQSGNVAAVLAEKNDLVGAPMTVKYILARASHIATWRGMVKNDPFPTTTLTAGFSTGHNVIFAPKAPIPIPQNMILKDGNWDIDQDIFTYGNSKYRTGMDLWYGTLNLIIAS